MVSTRGVPEAAARRFERLESLLAPYREVALAFSGGVDSTFLLAVLCRDPDRKVLAITAVSPVHSEAEQRQARELAERFGAEHREIRTNELRLEGFRTNPPDRCYHCKSALFSRMRKLSRVEGFEVLLEGSNLDDMKDYRPGSRALRELGVKSPLREAGLTKAEIRELSRRMGLATWRKPSMACLASRFPYGTRITRQALRRIEDCEEFLRERIGGPLRVRYYETMARLEVDPGQIPRLVRKREEVVAFFRERGFTHVSVDLEGYRTGSLNEGLGMTNRGSGSRQPGRGSPGKRRASR